MAELVASILSVIKTVVVFYLGCFYFCLNEFSTVKVGEGYFGKTLAWLENDAQRTRVKVHLFSLMLVFKLWNLPHYRHGTFHDDMMANLRNVAIPGTGLPMHWPARFKIVAYAFILFVYPWIAIAHAIYRVFFMDRSFELSNSESYVTMKKTFADDSDYFACAFRECLIMPADWFSYWRLNCRLASYHAWRTGAEGYKMEDKFSFLVRGRDLGVPVSPIMEVPQIVVKHRNEEGGLGIHFFGNALSGGDWIIQERLHNDKFVSSLLPDNAPLSTFRVITASRNGGLETSSSQKDIQALSCVFRAGRAGALTDHSSILFDVDVKTGDVKKGTTNAHWYVQGPPGWSVPWVSTHDVIDHPDKDVKVTGNKVPDIAGAVNLCVDAHRKMMPDVPMVQVLTLTFFLKLIVDR